MGPDRRAVAAQRRLDQDTAGVGGVVDGGDPYSSAWKNQFAPPQAGWERGTIVDVLPGGYAYRVSAGQRSFLWCSPGGSTGGFGVTGGRPLTTYVVGTPVWFVRHPDTPSVGSIVQADPFHPAHTANHPADSIWPFVRSGQLAEASHQFPLIASSAIGGPAGNMDGADFSSGRPVDGTAAGEWGVVMETGVCVFADPAQVYLRVDESTGVFGFYADQLLRVAGQNFQQYTSLSEHEHLEDEGELYGVVRKSVYPWENRGLWRYNQVTPEWSSAPVNNNGLQAGQGLRLNDPLAVQAANGLATSEPEYYTQISAARGFEYHGYLGQGGTSVVAAPVQLPWAYPEVPSEARSVPVGWTATPGDGALFAPSGRLSVDGTDVPSVQPYAVPPNTRLDGRDQPGLLEEHRTIAGRFTVRSATGIVLAKRPAIPVARPVTRPEDPAGDRPANYAASGLAGNTAAHAVVSDLNPPDGAPQRATGLFDVLSYAFNWENVHPFAYHANDWHLAQEGAAGHTIVNTRVPNFSLLAAQQYLDAPAPKAVDIDHRYGLVPVYENESSVCLLEDGTVVLTDGWGSEIRMHSGNIEFRCAGDISFFPGRNFNTWAGHDFMAKAHNSVDLVASNGDLRTKANRNSHHLAGNSGYGGFLFESKAVCPVYLFADRSTDSVSFKFGEDVASSGFNIICPNSELLALVQDATVKLEDTSEDGKITLDAGDTRHIRTRSNTFVSRYSVDGARVDLFAGDGDDPVPTANEFRATYNYLGADLDVYGAGFFRNSVATAGWLFALSHVSTGDSVAHDNLVVPYEGTASITVAATAVEERYTYLTDTYADEVGSELEYPDGAEDAEFSHRTTEQYLAEDYVFWESRWHTMVRNDLQTLPLWSEPEVVGLRSEEVTMPHPGTRWLDSDNYLGQDPGYTDPAGWVAIDRDANRVTYESGVFPPPRTPVSLSDSLAVTVPLGPYGCG